MSLELLKVGAEFQRLYDRKFHAFEKACLPKFDAKLLCDRTSPDIIKASE